MMPADSCVDTIVALASPAGRSERAILRIGGDRALDVAAALFRDAAGRPLDRLPGFSLAEGSLLRWGIPARLYLMRAPRSYTREDVVELHVAGNPLVAEAVLRAAIEHGARLARPGEFTRRAVENGRLSPDQAEAVIRLIRAGSRAELAAAADGLAGAVGRVAAAWLESASDLAADMEAELDLGEEPGAFLGDAAAADRLRALAAGLDRLCCCERAGAGRAEDGRVRVVLAGAVNAGKSLLYHRLTGRAALVSAEPGTTRDVLEAPLGPAPDDVAVLDTAGLGAPAGEVELLAAAAAERAWRAADLLLLVLDRSAAPEGRLIDRAVDMARAVEIPLVLVRNKCDLPVHVAAGSYSPQGGRCLGAADVSALTGEGCSALAERIAELVRSGAVERTQARAGAGARRFEVMREARARLARAGEALSSGLGMACAADDLGAAVKAVARHFRPAAGRAELDEAVLNRIFARFCIGK